MRSAINCSRTATKSPFSRLSAVELQQPAIEPADVPHEDRNNTRGRQTLYLVYEAYEAMALERMRALAQQALAKFAIRDVILVHRLGRLQIGETSVLIAVASAHRGAAFDACRWLIDTLKKTVPILKKEHFVDGAVWADGERFPEEIVPTVLPVQPG
jgi:molybdopterin synthase catalytic subunit